MMAAKSVLLQTRTDDDVDAVGPTLLITMLFAVYTKNYFSLLKKKIYYTLISRPSFRADDDNNNKNNNAN